MPRGKQTNVVATYVLNAANGTARVYWYSGTSAYPSTAPAGSTRTVYWNPSSTVVVTLPDGATTYEQLGHQSKPATPVSR